MRYPFYFILAALFCLLFGEALGIWMGKSGDHTLAPAHAHLNLVGWVSLALYGLVHRSFPALAASRLATAQFALALIGAFTLPAGIAVVLFTGNPVFAIASSLIAFIGTLLFAIMFARHAGKSAA